MTRLHTILALVLIVVCVGMTGCGTLITRGGYEHFGAYPYQGVGQDMAMLVNVPKAIVHPDGIGEALLVIVSLPCDLIADTVLLPVDAIWWIRGKKKDGWLSSTH